MKVLLIRPPAPPNYPLASFPLGLAYLASYLESGKHIVKICDCHIEKMDSINFLERLKKEEFDVVGISCMTIEYSIACEIAKLVKSIRPECLIVFGGVHPSNAPTETIKNAFIDYVVIGEGELTLCQLITAIENNYYIDNIDGLVFKQNGEIKYNNPRKFIEDLDEVPFPAYHLLSLERYYNYSTPPRLSLKRKRYMSIFTSRGCPYNCIFCHKNFGIKFRSRSPNNVFTEIKFLYEKYSIREFVIEDDNFTMDLLRAKNFCDLIIENNLDISVQFPNGIRADRIDEELMSKLSQIGTHTISIGIESGVSRIQKLIRKNLDLTSVKTTIGLAKKYNILTNGFLMMDFLEKPRRR